MLNKKSRIESSLHVDLAEYLLKFLETFLLAKYLLKPFRPLHGSHTYLLTKVSTRKRMELQVEGLLEHLTL